MQISFKNKFGKGQKNKNSIKLIHIFWEGYTIWKNLLHSLDFTQKWQNQVEDFFIFLWASQKTSASYNSKSVLRYRKVPFYPTNIDNYRFMGNSLISISILSIKKYILLYWYFQYFTVQFLKSYKSFISRVVMKFKTPEASSACFERIFKRWKTSTWNWTQPSRW